MGNFSEMKRQLLEPIDEETAKGIRELIEEARPFAEAYKKNVWELILILKKLNTQYGQKNILRWADPLGINWRTAYRWREIAKCVDAEWVKKFGSKINISKAQVLAQYYSNFNDLPEEVIKYAISKDTTATSLAGYIQEVNSVSEKEIEQLKEEAKYRVAEFAEKAELEQVERGQLEQLADEKPALALQLTQELSNAAEYRKYRQQEDRAHQSLLMEMIEAKTEPKFRRFLESIERELDEIKLAIKMEADSYKFKRTLKNLIDILTELDAITPEEIEIDPEQAVDSGIDPLD